MTEEKDTSFANPSGTPDAPTPVRMRRQLQRKALAKPLIVFAVLIAAGTALLMTGARRDADTLAQTQKFGILTAEEVNTAFEKVSGKLVSRPVLEGTRVKKGDLLMALDPIDTEISIRKLKAQIAENEAAVESAKRGIAIDLASLGTTEKNAWRTIEGAKAALDAALATEKRAEADYRRASDLIKARAVSQADFDSARSAWENARAGVTSARKALAAATVGADPKALERLGSRGSADGMRLSSVEDQRAAIENRRLTVRQLEAQGDQLRASLDALEVEKGRLELRAPEDGKIVKLLYQEGEMVSAGSPAVLLESGRQYYEIYVSEKDAARFAEGKTVTGETPDGTQVKGTVRVLHRAPAFADMRGTRERGQADLTSFVARVYIEPAEAAVPGMTIKVKTDD